MSPLAAELASLPGTAELLAPSLAIEGVVPVALPLLPGRAERIIAAAEAAPHGRGAETVVDPAVRRCWQVGPDRVRLGGRHWAKTLTRSCPSRRDTARPWPTTWCVRARAVRPSRPTTRTSKAAPRRCCGAGGTGGRTPTTRRRRSWSGPLDHAYTPADLGFAALTLPCLADLARRWIEGGGTRHAPPWREAHDLAGHMAAQWPTQGGYERHKTPSDAARMLATLRRLDDTAATLGFLTGVTAEGCCEKGDNDAVPDALGRLPQGSARR